MYIFPEQKKQIERKPLKTPKKSSKNSQLKSFEKLQKALNKHF
jgi:hypothetical protein